MTTTEAKVETLKALKEWSSWLVAIDAGALALLGTVAKESVGKQPCFVQWSLSVGVVSLLLSLVAASFLVGAVPVFIQRVGGVELEDCRGRVEAAGITSVYDFKFGGMTLRRIAEIQHYSFLVAAFAATLALLSRMW